VVVYASRPVRAALEAAAAHVGSGVPLRSDGDIVRFGTDPLGVQVFAADEGRGGAAAAVIREVASACGVPLVLVRVGPRACPGPGRARAPAAGDPSLAVERARLAAWRLHHRATRRPAPAPFVYCCYGGAHTSVVCAAIHLGRLPSGRTPSAREIASIDGFDAKPPLPSGRLVGVDDAGSPVCVIGAGPLWRRVEGIASNLFAYWESRPVVVATLGRASALTRVGGILSHRLLPRAAFGRHLAAEGVRRCYPRLVDLVRRARRKPFCAP